MRILKYILITIVSIIALALILAIFAPKEFDSRQEIVINRSKTEVFDYLKYVKNQDNYGVWQLSDPHMDKQYEGTDGTVGFKYSWNSEVVGKGSQTIKLIDEGNRIETVLDFGFGEPAISFFTTEEPALGQTKVTWGIKGKTPYPFNLMNLFY